MDATRHSLAKEPICLGDQTPEAKRLVISAESMEQAGNWYLAGENYLEAERRVKTVGSPQPASKLLARAAVCFEIAGQKRSAARAYCEAASRLDAGEVKTQEVGELYNRAALLFRAMDEFFIAGTTWQRAAAAFERVEHATISTTDNLPPVPAAAGRFTVAGLCYTAAGDAFLLSGDNSM
jgi:hypothetical protein